MDSKEKKCNKYEGLFLFQDETMLEQHVNNCEFCRLEHEKYKKVSSLVKEVAPAYLKREQNNLLKKVACCFFIFLGISTITGYKLYDNYVYQNWAQGSMVSDMGLPVDEYGFLSI